jgi:hypothetical protein
MGSKGILRTGSAVGLLLALGWVASPPSAHAAWVNAGATLFQVGGSLRTITPTANTTVDGGAPVVPTCGTAGGTSMAIVQSSKLKNVDSAHLTPVPPVLLVATCLSNTAATAAQLNFLNPADGKVLKAISTTISGVVAAPSNGWVHLVNRPDKGNLLGCGNDGTIFSIVYSQFDTSGAAGTTTSVPRPANLPTNCAALGWDPGEKMIYQGFTGGTKSIGVHRWKDGTTTDLGNFNTPCTPSGVAISGGTLLVECAGESTILRLDKATGAILGVNGTLGILGLPAGTNLNSGTGLGDLACDPVTFQKNANGTDQFTDALWSRQGASGNAVTALEFPAFTCGLPSHSVVIDPVLGSLSPLAAGLSAPSALGPGAIPLAACFDAGAVANKAGDGLPDCWKTSGIDFDGDMVTDYVLCVEVNTNGDGVTLTQECADVNQKDLFVEIGWMAAQAPNLNFPAGFPAANPDPMALSQPLNITSVQSVRAAFAAAPVCLTQTLNCVPIGIRLHLQVDPNPVTFSNLAAPAQQVSSVSELVFTPCTPPAIDPTTGTLNVKSLSDAADYDAIKKSNFGAAEGIVGNAKAVNAKRLAFRYVVSAHNQTGTGGAGSTSSGCSVVGGADAATTLGSFAGTTDQQAGTFMHEFGHTLGLRHGGDDNINCKPNYLSVLSYNRQFAGSPIPGRRLDYSRAQLPDLNKTALDESLGLGKSGFPLDPSLSAIPPFFPAADQTVIGNDPVPPKVASSWTAALANATSIPWDKDKTTNVSTGDINRGPGGCDGSGVVLTGHDDWGNLLYRASAALDFANGARSTTAAEHTSVTAEQEVALFLAADLDGNGVPDAQDCGTFFDGNTFFCTHRIVIKPSSTPCTVNLSQKGQVTVRIESEDSVSPPQTWDSTVVVVQDSTLTFTGAAGTVSVQINKPNIGTCSAHQSNLDCQFSSTALAPGVQYGVVRGFFINPNPPHDLREFSARALCTGT